MKIVTVAQMRELERRAVESGVSENSLMETAGLTAARRLAQITDGIRGKRIVVLVGPGNNGGDAADLDDVDADGDVLQVKSGRPGLHAMGRWIIGHACSCVGP